MLARKAHVYRIYQTDDHDKIVDDNVWIDVMRIDDCVFNEPRGSPNGESHIDRKYVVLWGDNTVAMGASPPAPTKRKYEPLDVIQPPDKGQDPQDPSLPYVTIPLIKHTWFTYRGSEQGFGPQEVQWVFQNFKNPTGRMITALRITNNDLNNEIQWPPVSIGDPAPPMPLEKQINWDDYLQALQDGTVDDTQYVDVAVADHFKIRFPPSPIDQTGAAVVLSGQQVQYVMVNRQQGDGPLGVEDLFKSPPGAGAENGLNTPGGLYATDPFQAIVNVSWGGLAVEFGDGAEDAPDPSGGGSGSGGGARRWP
jgi:hypothetical protein